MPIQSSLDLSTQRNLIILKSRRWLMRSYRRLELTSRIWSKRSRRPTLSSRWYTSRTLSKCRTVLLMTKIASGRKLWVPSSSFKDLRNSNFNTKALQLSRLRRETRLRSPTTFNSVRRKNICWRRTLPTTSKCKVLHRKSTFSNMRLTWASWKTTLRFTKAYSSNKGLLQRSYNRLPWCRSNKWWKTLRNTVQKRAQRDKKLLEWTLARPTIRRQNSRRTREVLSICKTPRTDNWLKWGKFFSQRMNGRSRSSCRVGTPSSKFNQQVSNKMYLNSKYECPLSL